MKQEIEDFVTYAGNVNLFILGNLLVDMDFFVASSQFF